MSNNPKQYLIPGYGYYNDLGDGKQLLIPGMGYVNDVAPTVTPPANAGNFFLLFWE